MEKRFESIYNLEKCDKRVLEMWKDGSSLRSIVFDIKDTYGVVDDMVVLVKILEVLRDDGVVVMSGKIREVFNDIFVKKYHGNKDVYWRWVRDIRFRAKDDSKGGKILE